jgi:tetratricopeptide (TPR) repeat protein
MMQGASRVSGPVIKLRCTTWGQLAALYERDLKRGALFVRTTSRLPLGRETRVDVIMPTGTVITVDGRVAHHVAGGERGAGMELVIHKLPPSQTWVIESALARAGASSCGTGGTAEDDVQEDAGAARAEEELLAALEGELHSLRAMNPQQVLGVGYDAGEPEARAAFAELSKRYHPDRFARFESPRARQIAADIFVVVREAYRRIAEAGGRKMAGPSRGTPARGVPTASVRDPAAPVAIEDRGSAPVRRPGTPAQGVPTAGAGPVLRAPTPTQGVPVTQPQVTFRATTTAPAVPPPPRSSRLDADFLFGDLAAAPPPPAPIALDDPRLAEADALLGDGRVDDALAIYEQTIREQPTHRAARAGRELAFGLKKSAAGDRDGAARHFEAALEIEPWSDRAARELAALRRAATERGKGLLSKLLGKGEP